MALSYTRTGAPLTSRTVQPNGAPGLVRDAMAALKSSTSSDAVGSAVTASEPRGSTGSGGELGWSARFAGVTGPAGALEPYPRGVTEILRVGSEVASALASGRPVVALESTIFSELGLPEPANRECFNRVQAAVRTGGAVPALCGVLDGGAVVGADQDQAERLLRGSTKLGARDLGPAVAEGLDVGVTTVSATVTLAEAAGVEVFATGGIGGVHRGSEISGDVSADLEAMARHRVIVVSSGVKSFLDVSLTFERLETLGWPFWAGAPDRFPPSTCATAALN